MIGASCCAHRPCPLLQILQQALKLPWNAVWCKQPAAQATYAAAAPLAQSPTGSNDTTATVEINANPLQDLLAFAPTDLIDCAPATPSVEPICQVGRRGSGASFLWLPSPSTARRPGADLSWP